MVTFVAVEPVSSDRTAWPMEAAVRPYWAAASRFTETFTWGTSSDRELFTFTASGRASIWEMRSPARKARVS